AMVIDILGQTTNAIATHLRLAPVSIKHAHTEISPGRGQDQNQAVGADAKMPVADRPCHLSRVVDLLLEAVDIDIVIPYAVHFGEFHATPSVGGVCQSVMQEGTISRL